MYCKNCGAENDNNVRFCKECGTGLNSVVPPQTIQPNSVNASTFYATPIPQKKSKLKIFLIVAAVIVIAVIGIIIYAANVSFLKVDDVKDGVLYGYEDESIGDAFENYFDNCKWEAFVADDEDAIDVVEFTGYIEGSKFKMQFTHDYGDDDLDEDEFKIHGSWLDGQSLSQSEQNDVLYYIYNDIY